MLRPAHLPLLVVCAVLLVPAGRVRAQTIVTTCGQETNGPATLNADLDCTGFTGNALTMHGGMLTMNGHTITGGNVGVQCDRSCKIVGPGTVTGSSFVGVNAYGVGVTMSKVDVTNCGFAGAQVWKLAKISGPAVFSGNGLAITSSSAKLVNLTITGNGGGVGAGNESKNGSISIEGSTITGNAGTAIGAQHSIRVVNSTVTDNGTSGVYASGGYDCERKGSVLLINSTVTGNGTDPACGSTKPCADVIACKKPPRVKIGSTCGTSYQLDSGIPGLDWDACTQD